MPTEARLLKLKKKGLKESAKGCKNLTDLFKVCNTNNESS